MTTPLFPLINAGLLVPGVGVLKVPYRGGEESGTLLADGTIEFEGKIYKSPSSFSVAVKRKLNPSKHADDGWKTVSYKGVKLDEYRSRLTNGGPPTKKEKENPVDKLEKEATNSLMLLFEAGKAALEQDTENEPLASPTALLLLDKMTEAKGRVRLPSAFSKEPGKPSAADTSKEPSQGGHGSTAADRAKDNGKTVSLNAEASAKASGSKSAPAEDKKPKVKDSDSDDESVDLGAGERRQSMDLPARESGHKRSAKAACMQSLHQWALDDEAVNDNGVSAKWEEEVESPPGVTDAKKGKTSAELATPAMKKTNRPRTDGFKDDKLAKVRHTRRVQDIQKGGTDDDASQEKEERDAPRAEAKQSKAGGSRKKARVQDSDEESEEEQEPEESEDESQEQEQSEEEVDEEMESEEDEDEDEDEEGDEKSSGERPSMESEEDYDVSGDEMICTAYQWICCDAARCSKWRRVAPDEVPSGQWRCSMNADPRFASCSVAQELSNDEIDDQLSNHVCVHGCKRPPLAKCPKDKFMADLMRFYKARGEDTLQNNVGAGRTYLNGTTLDIFGLYKKVAQLGGFMQTTRLDEEGRPKGHINWAGEVFPCLRNFTKNNRATSVGTQLITNYRKYLLAYEVAHPNDVPWAPKPLGLDRPEEASPKDNAKDKERAKKEKEKEKMGSGQKKKEDAKKKGPGGTEKEDAKKKGPASTEKEDAKKKGPGSVEKEDAKKKGPGSAEKEGAKKKGPGSAEKEDAKKKGPGSAEKEDAKKKGPGSAEKDSARGEPGSGAGGLFNTGIITDEEDAPQPAPGEDGGPGRGQLEVKVEAAGGDRGAKPKGESPSGGGRMDEGEEAGGAGAEDGEGTEAERMEVDGSGSGGEGQGLDACGDDSEGADADAADADVEEGEVNGGAGSDREAGGKRKAGQGGRKRGLEEAAVGDEDGEDARGSKKHRGSTVLGVEQGNMHAAARSIVV